MIGFDVISYLDDRDIDYRTSGKNVGSGWIGIRCIFCGDNSFHLGINLEAASYSCFRCGAKGTGIALIAELEHCSKKQAYAITKKFLNLDAAIAQRYKEPIYTDEVKLKGLTKEFPQEHLDYLKNRNFDPAFLIRRYNLYAGTYIGDFKFRIVAPVYLDNTLVSLVGRDITDKSDQRYKALAVSKSKMPLKSTLYNIDSVQRDAIIVEGITDVWRIGDGCVATLGTKVTSDQVLLLRGIRNAYVLFDAEAKNEAEKLSVMLQGIVEHVEIILLDQGDPAELREHEVRLLRKELMT